MIKLYKDITKKYPILREIFLYGIIGGLSAFLDALSFIIFRKIGMEFYTSNFISINLGITFSFFLNTYYNFKKTDKLKKRAIKFFLVGYIGLLLSMLIMFVFVKVLNFYETLIKLLSIILVAVVQFIFNKIFTYGKK